MTIKRSGLVVAGTSPSSSAKDRGGRRGLGSAITWAHSSPKTAHESAAAPTNHFFHVPCSGVVIEWSPKRSPLRRTSRVLAPDL
jgi:hypothetical protein